MLNTCLIGRERAHVGDATDLIEKRGHEKRRAKLEMDERRRRGEVGGGRRRRKRDN
jgi:hypothetical protein